jgi:hypothetical protein
MSRFADDTEPAQTHDLDDIFPKVPKPPEREGLPAGFRMRADAHYVEVLDSPPGPSLRLLDVNAIDTSSVPAAPPQPALVESVRQHGVLQPLLVQQHTGPGGRYRLISGHQRLAAARSAGIGQVPCMLHAVTDARAAELASAARVTSVAAAAAPAATAQSPSAPVQPPSGCTTALDTTLRSIASAAALMAVPSAVARDGAAQLVAVESQRALRLLNVMRVLGGEYAIRRAAIPVFDLLERLRLSLEREYRACGLERSVRIHAERELKVYGSEELLRTAISSVVSALSTAVPHTEPRLIEILASGSSSSVAIEIREQGVTIPQRWAERAFDEAWPVAEGGMALMLFQAARRITISHGGSLVLQARSDGTVARFTLGTGRID